MVSIDRPTRPANQPPDRIGAESRALSEFSAPSTATSSTSLSTIARVSGDCVPVILRTSSTSPAAMRSALRVDTCSRPPGVQGDRVEDGAHRGSRRRSRCRSRPGRLACRGDRRTGGILSVHEGPAGCPRANAQKYLFEPSSPTGDSCPSSADRPQQRAGERQGRAPPSRPLLRVTSSPHRATVPRQETSHRTHDRAASGHTPIVPADELLDAVLGG